MPNITRGGDTKGLVRYLFGPGRANEHTNQHIVAGSFDIAHPDFYGGRTLCDAEQVEVAQMLDLDMIENDVNVWGNQTTWDYEKNEMVTRGRGLVHVWHCSLTLHPDEPALSDEQWAQIAQDFMDEMEFTEASGRSPARWIAVRHGTNKGGGDHIHIVANIVREDGTKVNVWRDYNRAQRACNTLEHKFGLAVVESREHQRGAIGESPAEQAAADRAGQPMTDKGILEVRMRAALTIAASEADYVRELRAQGVLVRPRYAHGGQDTVTGYSVALPDSEGQPTKWYGGGWIARDLRLPWLRMAWGDTPAERMEAVSEWNGRAKVRRDRVSVNRAMWRDMADAVDETLARMDAVPLGDDEALSAVAHEAAGIFSALAMAHGDDGWKFARAARALGRTAQYKPAPTRHRPAPSRARISTGRLLMSQPSRPRGAWVSEQAMTSSVRLGKAMVDLLDIHHQTVTARRTRAELDAALASLSAPMPEEAARAQSFLRQFGAVNTSSATPAREPASRPRAGRPLTPPSRGASR
ncbi:relaxase/mobilization nuclease domain-containing protein [Trueperella pyogenes]|uniref:relaxase/mobilization nuclease domain-containing protein n=1 Tax=Trueperella pyogenes TaxID=1661 RepID=UPI003251765E